MCCMVNKLVRQLACDVVSKPPHQAGICLRPWPALRPGLQRQALLACMLLCTDSWQCCSSSCFSSRLQHPYGVCVPVLAYSSLMLQIADFGLSQSRQHTIASRGGGGGGGGGTPESCALLALTKQTCHEPCHQSAKRLAVA